METQALQLIEVVVIALLPFATRWIFEGLQQLLGYMERLPKAAKVATAAVIGALLTNLGAWLGLPLPVDVTVVTEVTILGVLEGLAAAGFHKLKKDIR